MPTYVYTARDRQGRLQQGVKEAKDEHALAEFLKSNNLILTSLKSPRRSVNLTGLFKHISLTEKMLFTRHLEVMVRSGIPLLGALNILAEQTRSRYFKKVILEIKSNVERGLSLAEGMRKYQPVFSDLYVNMIEVGELSGNLEQVLKLLRVQMQKEHELIAKIKGALVYPSVIFVIMIGVGMVMVFYVMPKLFTIFEEMNVELPLLTRMIMSISKFIIAKWWLAIGGAILLVFSFIFSLRVARVKVFWHLIFFHLPLIGKLVKKTNIARITRTLHSLLKSGVSIVNALSTTGKTIGNVRYIDSLKQAGQQVEKGIPLSKAIESYIHLYPVLVIQMIRVGEETGNLSELLGEIADFYEAEVNEASKNLSTIVEPFLMVFIGTAIGFFAVAMIQPMYSIMNAL